MPLLCAFSARSGSKALLLLLVLIPVHAALAQESDCIALRQVDFGTSAVLDDADRQSAIEAFLGSCIDGDMLRSLLGAVSDALIEKGFVTTRPYLLEQDISDGQVEIRILPGVVEAIIDTETGKSSARIWSAFLFADEVLNLRDLETALEVIERPASVTASFAIKPGNQQGASVVEITTRELNPLRLELGVNAQTDLDSQLSFRLLLDNPFNLNDTVELRYNSGDVRETLQSNRSREFVYNFPLGSLLVGLSHSDIEYEQRLQGVNGSFVSRGDSITDTLRLSKVLTRNKTNKFGLSLGLELKYSRSFFEDELIEVSSYKTSQLRLDLQHDWLQPWGQIVTRYGYHQGLDSFGARDDDYYAPGSGFDNEARLQFEKAVIDSQLVLFLGDQSWQWRSHLFLQYSDDLLFDNDRLNLGSPYTVRGYSSALSGANAGYWRNDLIKQLRRQSIGDGERLLTKSITLSVGIDYGKVRCEADNPDTCGDIYGIGAGVEIADDNFASRLLWGHPLKEIGDDIGNEDRFLLDVRWIF